MVNASINRSEKDADMTLCQKCDKQASYGLINTTKKLFCVKHKRSFHVDVVNKKCKVSGCTISACYGKVGHTKKEFCATHAKLMGADHVNIIKKVCQECEKTATHGKLEDRVALYCKTHAITKSDANYTNVIMNRCTQENCDLYAYYGDPITRIKSKCKKHKEDADVPLYTRAVCSHPNCNIYPSYKNSKTKVCSAHKKDGDGFLPIHKSNRCQDDDCETQASYGLAGSKKALYCVKHRPNHTYVNLRRKKCEVCDTEASYGDEGTKIRRFCVEHKKPYHVNVSSKRCAKCAKQANFGIPGFTKETCAEHQAKGMVFNPKKRKRSQESTCSYCAADINYDEEFCSGCKRYIDLGGKTVKRHKKEEMIKLLLEKHFPKELASHDRRVAGGCSKRRPDFELTANWGIIVLEVDEDQHNRRTYSCECETTRMKQLYFDYGVQHLLFIRYNPDKYISFDAVGEAVADAKPERPKQRQEFLMKYIREQLAERKFENLGVVYLYYDGHSRGSVEIERLDPYVAPPQPLSDAV